MPIFPPKQTTPTNAGSSSAASPTPKGQKIPQSQRWKPTPDDQAEIDDLVYTLLSSGLLKSQIKTQVRKWGEKKQKALLASNSNVVIEMDARTIERYLSRARARMVIESGKTKSELREDSLNFYLTIARDLTADPRNRIIARERIDRLYGLDMPIKVAPTDPTGEQSFKHLSETELTARIIELAAQAGAGTDGEAAGGMEPTAATQNAD